MKFQRDCEVPTGFPSIPCSSPCESGMRCSASWWGLGAELLEGSAALGPSEERGWEARSPNLTLPALLPSQEERASGLGALVRLFGASVEGWPLEATYPLVCATSGRKAGWTPTWIWPGFSSTHNRRSSEKSNKKLPLGQRD